MGRSLSDQSSKAFLNFGQKDYAPPDILGPPSIAQSSDAYHSSVVQAQEFQEFEAKVSQLLQEDVDRKKVFEGLRKAGVSNLGDLEKFAEWTYLNTGSYDEPEVAELSAEQKNDAIKVFLKKFL